jgi:hypothetical protein
MKEPQPVCWIGFPEGQPCEFDIAYDNTTRIPGYRYSPIWALDDHPSTIRGKAKRTSEPEAR